MIKCCVIPPLAHLDLSHAGDWYYCLAHLYYQHEDYRKFFKKVKSIGGYVILDNGAAEHSLVTEDILLEIVRDLKPDEVIAPDILYDSKNTIKNLKRFIKRMEDEFLITHTKVFGCPQGKSVSDWLWCYEQMLNLPQVKVIGLSKISVPYCWKSAKNDQLIAESRNECVKYLVSHDLLLKPIHCLGMGDPKEYLYYHQLPKKVQFLIRSTDSCYTVLAALNSIDFGKNFERVKTDNSYFNKKLNQQQILLALKNIWYLKRILRGGEV